MRWPTRATRASSASTNYTDLLREPLFWRSLRNTLFFVVVGGPLTLVAALGGALLVNSQLARLRGAVPHDLSSRRW